MSKKKISLQIKFCEYTENSDSNPTLPYLSPLWGCPLITPCVLCVSVHFWPPPALPSHMTRLKLPPPCRFRHRHRSAPPSQTYFRLAINSMGKPRSSQQVCKCSLRLTHVDWPSTKFENNTLFFSSFNFVSGFSIMYRSIIPMKWFLPILSVLKSIVGALVLFKMACLNSGNWIPRNLSASIWTPSFYEV